MDSELEHERGRGIGSKSKSISAVLQELCPRYMAYGMSYDDYWHGDPEKAIAYRKVFELKQDVKNFDMWLQGKYVYDAICAVSPILRAFSKAKKPVDYLESPYPLSEQQAKVKEEEKERKQYEMMLTKMKAITAEFNKKFEKGGKG